MNDNILNVIMLVFFFFMIIFPVYMILKSFFQIVGYMKIVSEDEEKEIILEKCLVKFKNGYKYVEINPEIHNFKFELQEKIEKLAVNNGYIFLKERNNTLYLKKKEK